MINAPGSRKRRKALFPQDLSPPFVECLVCWTGITQMRLKLIAESDTIKARLWTWVVQRAFIGAWNKILRVSTKTKTKHSEKRRRSSICISATVAPDILKPRLLESRLLNYSKRARNYSKAVENWGLCPFTLVFLRIRYRQDGAPSKDLQI